MVKRDINRTGRQWYTDAFRDYHYSSAEDAREAASMAAHFAAEKVDRWERDLLATIRDCESNSDDYSPAGIVELIKDMLQSSIEHREIMESHAIDEAMSKALHYGRSREI